MLATMLGVTILLLSFAFTAQAATVTNDCEVLGSGMTASGISGDGHIVGSSSSTLGTWNHNSATTGPLVFVDPDFITCTINGSSVADFQGSTTYQGGPTHG